MDSRTFDDESIIVFSYKEKKPEYFKYEGENPKIEGESFFEYKYSIIVLDLEDGIVYYLKEVDNAPKVIEEQLHYNFDKIIELSSSYDFDLLYQKLKRNFVWCRGLNSRLANKLEKRFLEERKNKKWN